MNDRFSTHHWQGLALRGIVAILAAFVTFLWPRATLTALSVLFGCYAIVDGVFSLAEAVRRRSRAAWLFAVDGLLSIGAGLVALLIPAAAVMALVYLIAIWAIVTGVIELVAAGRLAHEIPGTALFALAGIASIVFGTSIVVWPEMGLVLLAALFAMYALFFGITLLIVSQALRAGAGAAPFTSSKAHLR